MIVWLKQLALIAVTGIYLTGCSSNIPDLIKRAPKGDIRIDEVQQKPDAFINSQVRWGGTIIQVENLAEKTHIEVLARKLTKNGKPDSGSRGQGRFKIVLSGFREPEEFPTDRLITVHGTLSALEAGLVGSYSYAYPVINPSTYYLWAEERTYRYYDYYDPYYYHWYPYWYRHPHPYYWH